MKIAVSYENENIFPHFGKSKVFKIYDVQEGKIVGAELLGASGSGHSAVAALLIENEVETVLCGGIGAGAEMALAEEGIEIISGVQGNADEAVEAYLRGELISEGVNCDHHHGEEEEEGCGGCGDSCGGCGGGGCGGCGGGCGGSRPPMLEGPNAGKKLRVHYKGTFNDGSQFDSSYDRGEPLEFTCGVGMMIPGFDEAVLDMKIGEEKDIHLLPEEAYGYPDPNAIFTINVSTMPGSENLEVGQDVYLSNTMGQQIRVKVVEKEGDTVTFDANNPMAGKELNFHIEMVEILD